MDIKIQTDFSEVYKWLSQTAVDLKMVDCIEAGVPQGAKNTKYSDSDTTDITTYALQNEFGDETHPQRSFLRPVLTDLFEIITKEIAKSMITDKYLLVCKKIASQMAERIRYYIKSNIKNPNADLTIRKWAKYMNISEKVAKEQKRTLIFSGETLKSIKGGINGI